MKIYFLILVLFVSGNLIGQEQDIKQLIISGNEFYRQQKFDQAVSEYAKALAIAPANAEAKYNYANALYRSGKQVEATKNFTELAAVVSDRALRSKTYYNRGVILSNQNNLEESIEAYKNALRQDPSDVQARENLQKALLELKKKTPPPPKQNDKKQEKEKQQQKQSKSKMNQREAEQRLQLLAQKEKEVQQRLQKEKQRMGGGQAKDW